MDPFTVNVERETLDNDFYRKVLFTGSHIQLVVMSLKVGEDIPLEVHDNIDQFIRVEQGSALVTIDGQDFSLSDDDVIIIPSGKEHYVKNSSSDTVLKLYSLYSPAEHPDGTVHETFADAKADEHHH